jgi:Protein of unknown function (DUF973)
MLLMAGTVIFLAIFTWNTVGASVLASLPVLIYGGLVIRARRPRQSSPTKVSLEEEMKSIGRIKLFSVFSIMGLLLQLVATIILFQRFALVSTPIQSRLAPAFPPDIVSELYVLLALGFSTWIAASISLWSSFTTFTKMNQSQFGRPRRFVRVLPLALYMLCVGSVLFLFGSHAVFDEPPAPGGTLSGPNLVPVMNFFVGLAFLGIFSLLGLAGFLGGMVLGLRRMGSHYNERALKYGAILFILPFINLLSPIVAYLESNAILRRLRSLPEGYRIMSVDNAIAQNEARIGFSDTFGWDSEDHTWKKAVTGTEMAGLELPAHMFVSRIGDIHLAKHYSWDNEKRMWVRVPNPPSPPPEGASLSPTLPGFAYALTAQGDCQYQWSDDEQRWILVDEIPWGFSDGFAPKVRGRYEAASLDDTRKRIYWDGKRKSWIDAETERPPATRPPPPRQAELLDFYEHGEINGGDMVKIRGEERYHLWSKEKQKWVMIKDLPEGFSRGENPNEAYRSDGSALDRWIEWDNAKETWVDFSPGRRLNIHGRIQ